MRQYVVLYLCKATFDEVRSIPYSDPPAPGSTHDCILFLRQPSQEPKLDQTRIAMGVHGWHQVEFRRTGLIESESINSPQWQVFQLHYEECLEHGNSLVWYP